MTGVVSPELNWFVGSQNRLLTMAVLANAQKPLTGYRVAVIADLPREKVYPELRRSVDSGVIAKDARGYRMLDEDLRSLLRKRVRLSWDEDWDEARKRLDASSGAEMSAILASLPTDSKFLRPTGWKPSRAARRSIKEMTRDPRKDALLRSMGLRTSERRDRPRGR